MDATKLSSFALFNQYLEVVNQVLGRNRDREPWSMLIRLQDRLLDDDAIVAVGVYEGDSRTPHDWASIRWNGSTWDPVEHGKADGAKLEVMIAKEHVTEVASNPKAFLEDPSKLSWDWLTHRLMDLASSRSQDLKQRMTSAMEALQEAV